MLISPDDDQCGDNFVCVLLTIALLQDYYRYKVGSCVISCLLERPYFNKKTGLLFSQCWLNHLLMEDTEIFTIILSQHPGNPKYFQKDTCNVKVLYFITLNNTI